MNIFHACNSQKPYVRAHAYFFCTSVRHTTRPLNHVQPLNSPIRPQRKCSALVDSSGTGSSSTADTDASTSVSSAGTSTNTSDSSSSCSSDSRRVQLPPPCDLGGAAPQARWNAISLAYLGDAVWEAYLRSYFYGHEGLSDSQLMYNRGVAAKANAKAQALCYSLLLSESWLTPAEVELTRWASNNSTVTPPKQVTRLEYKQATALEVMVAHLYLTDTQRLQQLMDWLLEPNRVSLWHTDTQQQVPQVQQPSPQASSKQGKLGQRRRRGGEASPRLTS